MSLSRGISIIHIIILMGILGSSSTCLLPMTIPLTDTIVCPRKLPVGSSNLSLRQLPFRGLKNRPPNLPCEPRSSVGEGFGIGRIRAKEAQALNLSNENQFPLAFPAPPSLALLEPVVHHGGHGEFPAATGVDVMTGPSFDVAANVVRVAAIRLESKTLLHDFLPFSTVGSHLPPLGHRD